MAGFKVPISLKMHWPVLLVLLCGLVTTGLLAHWSARASVRQAELSARELAHQQAQWLDNRVALHAEMLRGLQNTLIVRPDIDNETLLQILERQNALIRHPGFVGIIRIRTDHPAKIDHVYPRNVALSLAGQPEVIRTIQLSGQSARGLLSQAFIPAGQKNPHVMLFFPVPEGGIAMVYRLDLLGSALGAGKRIRGWRLIDRGSVTDRGAPLQVPVLLDHSPREGADSTYASALADLPGRQWMVEIWTAPQAASVLTLRIMALGGLATLCLTLLFFMLRRVPVFPEQKPASDPRQEILFRVAQECPELIVIRDRQGRIIFANNAAQALFATGSRPLEERRDALLVSAELGQLAEVFHCETSWQGHYYEVLLQPVDWEQQRLLAMFAHDRTQQQNDLISMQRRLIQHEKIQALLSEFFWEQDERGCFTLAGGALLGRHGLSPQFFIGKKLRELGDGGLDEAAWLAHERLRGEHKTFRDLAYVLEIDHTPIEFLLSGLPKYSPDGEFAGYYGIGRDVSALRRSERKLQAERQRIVATLESISDGIITTDLDGRIGYLNPVASALSGWEVEDALGQPIEQVMQMVEPESRLPLVTLLRRALESGQAPQSHRCGILLNRFGLSFLIQEAVACIRNEQGELIGAAVVFRDLSEWMNHKRGQEPLPREEGAGH